MELQTESKLLSIFIVEMYKVAHHPLYEVIHF